MEEKTEVEIEEEMIVVETETEEVIAEETETVEMTVEFEVFASPRRLAGDPEGNQSDFAADAGKAHPLRRRDECNERGGQIFVEHGGGRADAPERSALGGGRVGCGGCATLQPGPKSGRCGALRTDRLT